MASGAPSSTCAAPSWGAPGERGERRGAGGVRTACVFGLWHLGSVAAACLAESGLLVRGVDPDPAVVGELRAGRPPIFEPGLEALIAQQVVAGRLSFRARQSEVVDHVSEVRHELAREALRFHGIDDGMEITSMADLPAGTGVRSSSA